MDLNDLHFTEKGLDAAWMSFPRPPGPKTENNKSDGRL